MIRRLLILVLMAAPLSAQANPDRSFWSAAPRVAEPTDRRATAMAEAERLMAAFQVKDLFANVTDEAVPRLRHGPTGLVCSFYPGGPGAIEVGGGASGLPRGDLVICRSKVGGQPLIQSAIRRREPLPNLDAALEAFVAGVRGSYPGMAPEGETTYSSGGGLARAARQAYVAERDGLKLMIYVTYAQHGEWGVGQVMIGRHDRADQIRMFADREFDRARREIGRTITADGGT